MKRAAKPIDLTLEREVQADCIRLYESLGCEVVVFAQHGRLGSGTRQTPGITDLKVYCRRKRASWWHEVKGPSGEQSDAQKKFQALVAVCGETYKLGGMEAALEQLRAIGILPATVVDAVVLKRSILPPARRRPIPPHGSHGPQA